VIDTSVLVAGLVTNHEFHTIARPHVAAAARGQVPGIVLAETWAALRRAPWNLDARTVETTLASWGDEDRIVATPTSAYAAVLRTGRSLNLGGNVHDLLIALTCREHGLPLVTLDRRQSTLAGGLAGLEPTLILPTG
jgi:predicted nucleic acid-binding protein